MGKAIMEILKSLEKKLGKSIVEVPLENIINKEVNGYSINNENEITGLNLSNNDLIKIPEEVFDCAKLERLSLFNNKINEIPDRIEKLKTLRQLELLSNSIEVISENIRELDQLEFLSLVGNKLRELPKEVFELDLPVYMDFASEKNYHGIFLKDNPIENPPIEILSQSKEAVI